MRTAHTNRGWIEADDGTFLGVSLGFDFCAEHEMGATALRRALGVDPTQPGFEAIRVTRPPEALRWQERKVRKPPAVKSRWLQKSVEPDKLNEAVLYVGASTGSYLAGKDLFLVAAKQLGPMIDLRSSHYDPAHGDMVAAWSGYEAMIWVRGTANILRLREVHDALVHADAVFNAPLGQGFTRRDGGLSFGIASRFSPAFKQQMLADQQARQRLDAAAQATGVHQLLADHQRKFHALSPDWMDPQTERVVVFFLNPADQRTHRSGWFTVAELRQWAEGKGPVFHDPVLEAAERGTDTQPSVSQQIRAAFQAAVGQDVKMRQLRVCWMDEAHTRLGVDVWPAHQGAEGWFMAPGLHDLEAVLADPKAHAQWYEPAPVNVDAPTPVRQRRRP